jgi:hypothetical protein
MFCVREDGIASGLRLAWLAGADFDNDLVCAP